MTVKDVANYLSVSPATIYRWAKSGEIPFVPMHGCLRFIQEEIDAWMTNREMGTNERYGHLRPANFNV